MFFEPQHTPYDLTWNLFGIPVRVHPWFWLMAALLGWRGAGGRLPYVLFWIVCVFLSVLVHELGHVLMGRLFGARSHIVLHAFGGLAVGSSALRSHWQRILVYLAGPGAGFLLYGLVWWYCLSTDVDQIRPLGQFALGSLLFINLYWGLMNLLPIWPLDGGQISRDLLGWLMPGRGVRVALVLSILTAGLIALNALSVTSSGHGLPLLEHLPYLNYIGGIYSVLLFGSLALNSYQALQMESHRGPWDRGGDLEDRW